MPWARRLSASGSPPSRASASETRATLPSPKSRRRPRMTRRLDPASGSARLDEEVEAVAIAVSARRGRAHEGSREGLVGMAALGLDFPGWSGSVDYVIHYLIIWGMAVDISEFLLTVDDCGSGGEACPGARRP